MMETMLTARRPFASPEELASPAEGRREEPLLERAEMIQAFIARERPTPGDCLDLLALALWPTPEFLRGFARAQARLFALELVAGLGYKISVSGADGAKSGVTVSASQRPWPWVRVRGRTVAACAPRILADVLRSRCLSRRFPR